MSNDKIFKVLDDMNKKIDKGEKQGTIKCPYCGGTINYAYENAIAMRAKCDSCEFRMFA